MAQAARRFPLARVLPACKAQAIETVQQAVVDTASRLQVGDTVVLQISKIGKECHTRCAIFQTLGDCVMPREGVFARVLKSGEVGVGDAVAVAPTPTDQAA